ncbi:hypothetical protein [Mangrovivirga cuniculi]|uniref:Uncharacterized protein n=1 Tax=Mangrovivirga cuniculi TaxID=2715131 RepID=A0A4D7K1G1_9BACT|nr:hypothetical protein [Mangrovivirga cuniculi]QCK16775.1 hypothetical protein DCC35_19580 [Mangrovivirga cuniculi]
MKNIYKLSIVSIIFLFSSCFLEEEKLTDNVSEAADITIDGNTTYLRGETESIVLDMDFKESPSAQIMEVRGTKQLITSAGNSEVVEIDPLTSPTELVFDQNDLFNDLPVNGEVLSEEDLLPGDRWEFDFTIVMEDGRELKSRNASDWNVNFSCPSDLAGAYIFTSTGAFGDGSGGQTGSYSYTGEVTLTQTDEGIYEIDDMSFGLYPQGYSDTAPSGRIRDICNTISDLGDTDQYSDPFTINGTVSEVDGTISLTWSNTYGDTGEVILVPVQ